MAGRDGSTDGRRLWTSDDQSALVRMLDAGVPVKRVAHALGRTPGAVYMRVTLTGLRPRRPIPGEVAEAIAVAFEGGETQQSIADRYGYSRGRVGYLLRRDGVVRAGVRLPETELPFDSEIVRLSTAGMRISRIAREVGQPAWRVRNRLCTLARRDALRELRADARQSSLSSSGRKIGRDDTAGARP